MSRHAELRKEEGVEHVSTKEDGALKCWRDQHRICSSQCVAWVKMGTTRKIYCKALPSGQHEIAEYVEEENGA